MEKNIYTWDFFVAHAGADKATAESLYGLLAPHCRVFLDSYCLLLGDDWDQELPVAQRNSLITIVLVSSRTEKAYYQREEIAAAIELARKDKDKHRVVPIFLDDRCDLDTIPYGLRLKHGLSVPNESGLLGVSRSLLELLNRLEQRPPSVNNQNKQLAVRSEYAPDESGLIFADIAVEANNNFWRGGREHRSPNVIVFGEEKPFKRECNYVFGVPGFVIGPDPSFDITVLNLNDKPVLLTAVGVEIISIGFNPPTVAGIPEAVKVTKTDSYIVEIPDLLAIFSDKIAQWWAQDRNSPLAIDVHRVVSTRLSDPVYLQKEAPYRYSLFLEKYYEHIAPHVILRMWGQTNYGQSRSEEIYMRK